jgi:hypothetical protein
VPFDIKDYIMVAAGAIIALVVSVLIATAYVHWYVIPHTQTETRALVQSEARDRALELIKKRSEDNAEISNFDLEHFCTEFGGKWVQSNCID